MTNKIAKAIVKLINTTDLEVRTLIFYFKFYFAWDLGRKIKIEGKIHTPSLGGSVRIGNRTRIGPNVRIDACKGANIIVGENVTLNQGTIIVSKKSVKIGDHCRIGEYVSIRDNDHKFEDLELKIYEQGFTESETVISEDVWIGRGASIMKGVNVGKGAVIGAGSIVTKDVEEYAIVVGIPAKKIKSRLNSGLTNGK